MKLEEVYNQLEELHDFVIEQDLKHREEAEKEIERQNKILEELNKGIEELEKYKKCFKEINDLYIELKKQSNGVWVNNLLNFMKKNNIEFGSDKE